MLVDVETESENWNFLKYGTILKTLCNRYIQGTTVPCDTLSSCFHSYFSHQTLNQADSLRNEIVLAVETHLPVATEPIRNMTKGISFNCAYFITQTLY